MVDYIKLSQTLEQQQMLLLPKKYICLFMLIEIMNIIYGITRINEIEFWIIEINIYFLFTLFCEQLKTINLNDVGTTRKVKSLVNSLIQKLKWNKK